MYSSATESPTSESTTPFSPYSPHEHHESLHLINNPPLPHSAFIHLPQLHFFSASYKRRALIVSPFYFSFASTSLLFILLDLLLSLYSNYRHHRCRVLTLAYIPHAPSTASPKSLFLLDVQCPRRPHKHRKLAFQLHSDPFTLEIDSSLLSNSHHFYLLHLG